MPNEEKEYAINWNKLSNDKLLELWLGSQLDEEELSKIEQILKDREVIKECPSQ